MLLYCPSTWWKKVFINNIYEGEVRHWMTCLICGPLLGSVSRQRFNVSVTLICTFISARSYFPFRLWMSLFHFFRQKGKAPKEKCVISSEARTYYYLTGLELCGMHCSKIHYWHGFTNGCSIYWPIKSLNRVCEFSTEQNRSLDSEDGYRTDCRNVSRQQQFFVGFQSPGDHFQSRYVTPGLNPFS